MTSLLVYSICELFYQGNYYNCHLKGHHSSEFTANGAQTEETHNFIVLFQGGRSNENNIDTKNTGILSIEAGRPWESNISLDSVMIWLYNYES